MNINRRKFLKITLSSAAAIALSGCDLDNEKEKYQILSDYKYKILLPELFDNPPEVPAHVPIAIIGSGFGGSISALRLSQAGKKVAVIERGNRWPTSKSRNIFAHDMFPDGRSFWHREKSIFPALPYDVSDILNLKIKHQKIRKFSGVLDVIELDNGVSNEVGGLNLLLGTAVGGGSIIYTGVHAIPKREFFKKLYPSELDYDNLVNVYAQRVQNELNYSTMPNDIYNSIPFKHSRDWDKEVSNAGYTSEKSLSNFNWDVIRDELSLRSLGSATLGLTNFGNSNGSKNDLRQNYIPRAEATGNTTIYHNQEVTNITKYRSGYKLDIIQYDPFGTILKRTSMTCDKLIMSAGSYHTTRMLKNAKSKKTIKGLNRYVGKNWGDNHSKMAFRQGKGLDSYPRAGTQGSPSASSIYDPNQKIPTLAENWANAGLLEVGVSMILSVGADTNNKHRGKFIYNREKGDSILKYNSKHRRDSTESLRNINKKIAYSNNQNIGAPGFNDVIDTGAHPIGGMQINKATDIFGRVKGVENLYVMDGSLLPGNNAGANPVLMISALCEKNIEHLINVGEFN